MYISLEMILAVCFIVFWSSFFWPKIDGPAEKAQHEKDSKEIEAMLDDLDTI